jgi:hypothetical protein
MDSSTFLLGATLLVMVIGIVWLIIYLYSQRLTRIDDELRAITVMLSEMPREEGLREYMFSQDQQLRSIGEKLDTHPDHDLLQRHIPEHTHQLRTLVSMLGEGSNTERARADLGNSLGVINDSLEKVLWSLRFDEDKYAESTAATGNRFTESGKAKVKGINKDSETLEDTNSMKAILKNNDDSYDAMLKYMQQTGRGGSNALHALDKAGGLHNR